MEKKKEWRNLFSFFHTRFKINSRDCRSISFRKCHNFTSVWDRFYSWVLSAWDSHLCIDTILNNLKHKQLQDKIIIRVISLNWQKVMVSIHLSLFGSPALFVCHKNIAFVLGLCGSYVILSHLLICIIAFDLIIPINFEPLYKLVWTPPF